MKTNITLRLVILSLLAVLLISCSNDDENEVVNDQTPQCSLNGEINSDIIGARNGDLNLMANFRGMDQI